MNYLLLSVSMLACLGGTVIRKFEETRLSDKERMYRVMSAAVSLSAGLTLLLVALCTGTGLHASAFTILVGILFGVITALQQIFNLRALRFGPMSYTSVIVSLSMILPALSGFLLWDETLRPLQLAGMALIIVCIVLSADRGGQTAGAEKSFPKWIVSVGVTFLCTGAIGILQKWHQKTVGDGESAAFLIIAFAFSFLYSVGGMFVLSAREKKLADVLPMLRRDLTPLLAALMLLSGFCAALNNKLNLYLSGVIDSAVFFPVVNGGGLILSLLAAVLLFRERLPRRKWIGIGIGFAAILCLCIQ